MAAENFADKASLSTEKWVPLSLTLVEYPEGLIILMLNDCVTTTFFYRRSIRKVARARELNTVRHPCWFCCSDFIQEGFAHGKKSKFLNKSMIL
jgi:hypothetical protein